MLLFFPQCFMCPKCQKDHATLRVLIRIFGSIWRCTSRWYVTMTPASIRPASSWTICMAAAQSSTLSSGPPACYLEEPSSYSWSSSRSTFPYCVNKSAKPQSERGTVMDRLSEVKWSEVNVKWSEVKWSEVKWVKWSGAVCFEVKWWSECAVLRECRAVPCRAVPCSACDVTLVKCRAVSEVKWSWESCSWT